jgi:hypothetical protein
LYKSAVIFAPTGYPPRIPIRIGIKASPLSLKTVLVDLSKNRESNENDFEEAM